MFLRLFFWRFLAQFRSVLDLPEPQKHRFYLSKTMILENMTFTPQTACKLQNDLILEPKTTPKWTRNHPDLHPKTNIDFSTQIAPKMLLKLTHNWAQNGSKTDPGPPKLEQPPFEPTTLHLQGALSTKMAKKWSQHAKKSTRNQEFKQRTLNENRPVNYPGNYPEK